MNIKYTTLTLLLPVIVSASLMTTGCNQADNAAANTTTATATSAAPLVSAVDDNVSQGDAYYGAQNWDQALSSYKAALWSNLPSGLADQQGSRAYVLKQASMAHLRLAEKAYLADPQTAIDQLKASLAAYPDNSEARNLMPDYLHIYKWWKSGMGESGAVYDPNAALQVASANVPVATPAAMPWIGGADVSRGSVGLAPGENPDGTFYAHETDEQKRANVEKWLPPNNAVDAAPPQRSAPQTSSDDMQRQMDDMQQKQQQQMGQMTRQQDASNRAMRDSLDRQIQALRDQKNALPKFHVGTLQSIDADDRLDQQKSALDDQIHALEQQRDAIPR